MFGMVGLGVVRAARGAFPGAVTSRAVGRLARDPGFRSRGAADQPVTGPGDPVRLFRAA